MSKKQTFEQVFEDFKRQKPNELQLRRWQFALLRKATGRHWTYAAAGLVAGLAIGIILTHEFVRTNSGANFYATFVQYDVKNM